MAHRFYIEPGVSSRDEDSVTLHGDEAHHFSRVMRGAVGDSIFLFDGSGELLRGTVEQISKTSVSVRILETIPDRIESPVRLTVASALPKGDRQKFLAEKLAELGAARLVPLRVDRSVAKADAGVVARLQRTVIEASKQCERNFLMEITDEKSIREFDDYLKTLGDVEKFILHPVRLGEVGQCSPKTILNDNMPKQIAVLVGPEGSFTDREIELVLQLGFKPLDLGARILRTETACIAAASMLLTYAG